MLWAYFNCLPLQEELRHQYLRTAVFSLDVQLQNCWTVVNSSRLGDMKWPLHGAAQYKEKLQCLYTVIMILQIFTEPFQHRSVHNILMLVFRQIVEKKAKSRLKQDFLENHNLYFDALTSVPVFFLQLLCAKMWNCHSTILGYIVTFSNLDIVSPHIVINCAFQSLLFRADIMHLLCLFMLL